MNHSPFLAHPGKFKALTKYDPAFTGKFKEKKQAVRKLESDIAKMADLQDILYAQNSYAVLLIFQAMDAAGKDSAIKHVMSGINPQGCQVFSFKAPSAEELDHDYLWRSMKALPERGRIGIFNRSYYEEVLAVRVHPELLVKQRLPSAKANKKFWLHRFEEINQFERYLTRNGIIPLKFFLNVSKKEQKQRFLDRINKPDKNWKFSLDDVRDRAHWNEYMHAYEEVFRHTSTQWAPWYIVPADHKWFSRVVISDIIVSRLQSLKLRYPAATEKHRNELSEAKKYLERE